MQRQPPDRNNPANPLIKVASLDIERIPSRSKEERIVIQANFKRSENIQGFTTDESGMRLTLTFGMSIRKASLHLSLEKDDGSTASGIAKIERVAFERPLAVTIDNKETKSISKSSKRQLTISARVKAAASSVINKNDAAAQFEAGGATGKTDSSSYAKKQTIKYSTCNVTGTHADDQAHWEIRPQVDPSRPTFLEGNLFMSTNGKVQAACYLKHKGDSPKSQITLRGSTYINMIHMEVDLKQITDDLGSIKTISDVRDLQRKRFTPLKEKKNRILKEIIRKNLVSQGLNTEGALVEISRACA